LFQCLLDLSSLGLEPDGRNAHLIPYGTKCTLIVDWKGIVDLLLRSGEISYLDVDVVHENDEFDYLKGSQSFLKHKQVFKDRGPVICVYSFVKLKDGGESFDLMGTEDVEKIRKRSKSANNGPWVTDWSEMAKKTVFRRHSKRLPLSSELREKVEIDDKHALTEEERFEVATPVTVIDKPNQEQPKPRKTRSDKGKKKGETVNSEIVDATDPIEPPTTPEKPPSEPSAETLHYLLADKEIPDSALIDWLRDSGQLTQAGVISLDQLGEERCKGMVTQFDKVLSSIELNTK